MLNKVQMAEECIKFISISRGLDKFQRMLFDEIAKNKFSNEWTIDYKLLTEERKQYGDRDYAECADFYNQSKLFALKWSDDFSRCTVKLTEKGKKAIMLNRCLLS